MQHATWRLFMHTLTHTHKDSLAHTQKDIDLWSDPGQLARPAKVDLAN